MNMAAKAPSENNETAVAVRQISPRLDEPKIGGLDPLRLAHDKAKLK